MSITGSKGNNARMRSMLMLAVLALAGCATAPQHSSPAFAPTAPRPEMLPPATEGAIFQSGREISLFQDTKARRIGDMITIVLVEKTQATKQATTNSSKDQEVTMKNPTLQSAPLSFCVPGNLPLNGRSHKHKTDNNRTRRF